MQKTGIAVWEPVEIPQKKCAAWRFPMRSIWVERIESEWHVLSLPRDARAGGRALQPVMPAHAEARLLRVAALPPPGRRPDAAVPRASRQARGRAARPGPHPPARAEHDLLPGASRLVPAFHRRATGRADLRGAACRADAHLVRGPGHRGALLGPCHPAAPLHRFAWSPRRTSPSAPS